MEDLPPVDQGGRILSGLFAGENRMVATISVH